MQVIYMTLFYNAEGTNTLNYFFKREDAVKRLKDISGYDAPLTGPLPWTIDEGKYYASLTEINVQ